MGNPKSLLSGRKLESRVLGIPFDDGHTRVRPQKLSLERSIDQQIKRNWKNLSKAVKFGESYYHNPYNPEMGETNSIWRAVKRAVERKWKGEYFPVLLFVSAGPNSLDWYHGVDAFYYWHGVYVTIDLATGYKKDRGKKADFILTEEQIKKPHLSYFGQQVANLLIQRRVELDRKCHPNIRVRA